ncbi:MAG: hypothetical protein ABR598_00530 [Candidatus Dormibacteria bacterium]
MPRGTAEPDYFPEVCEAVLGPWFKERGFWLLDAYCTPTMVAYRRRRTFIRFRYMREDAPRYPVMVGLGEVRDGFGLLGPRKPIVHGIGLWEAVDDEADREVLRGTFQTRGELERLLERVRDQALRHAEPLLDDPALMHRRVQARK